MDAGKKWGLVSEKFNTYKDELWYGAADNIETVWPIFLNYIEENFPNPKGLRALDFGCGTGMFCGELKSLGFDATGIDISAEMIEIGKENLPADIKLFTGDTSTAKELSKKEGPFNLITSIMVLQFVETEKLSELAESIALGGHIIFVNHNPLQLEARGVKDNFPLRDTNVSVPVYQRSAENYDKIFLDLGFEKTLEKLEQTSEKIKQKYKVDYPPDIRKYIILAYQKT